MANYKLTNKAVLDLTKIWEYTFEIWSEKQADKYYTELITSCEKIANNPLIGKSYQGISKELLGLNINQHIIFYRNLNTDAIEITRILHQRMDLTNRIIE